MTGESIKPTTVTDVWSTELKEQESRSPFTIYKGLQALIQLNQMDLIWIFFVFRNLKFWPISNPSQHVRFMSQV